jgi:hypothetical protein
MNGLNFNPCNFRSPLPSPVPSPRIHPIQELAPRFQWTAKKVALAVIFCILIAPAIWAYHKYFVEPKQIKSSTFTALAQGIVSEKNRDSAHLFDAYAHSISGKHNEHHLDGLNSKILYFTADPNCQFLWIPVSIKTLLGAHIVQLFVVKDHVQSLPTRYDIVFYDPQGRLPRGRAEEVLEALKKQLPQGRAHTQVSPISMQKDSYNCGPWGLWFADQLLVGDHQDGLLSALRKDYFRFKPLEDLAEEVKVEEYLGKLREDFVHFLPHQANGSYSPEPLSDTDAQSEWDAL